MVTVPILFGMMGLCGPLVLLIEGPGVGGGAGLTAAELAPPFSIVKATKQPMATTAIAAEIRCFQLNPIGLAPSNINAGTTLASTIFSRISHTSRRSISH